jgi:hypothetical protein
MALRSLSARHFGARSFASIAGLQTTIIPIPPVPVPLPSGGGGGGRYLTSAPHNPFYFDEDDDDVILVVVSAAMNFLEQ